MLFLISQGQTFLGVLEVGNNIDDFYRRARKLISSHFNTHPDNVGLHINEMGYSLGALQRNFQAEAGGELVEFEIS
jgi:hypothetical protein|tara:strand:+ start:7608 stop:7835 length:228 start_codon:yes stop_codon:yes gene_type:complete